MPGEASRRGTYQLATILLSACNRDTCGKDEDEWERNEEQLGFLVGLAIIQGHGTGVRKTVDWYLDGCSGSAREPRVRFGRLDRSSRGYVGDDGWLT